MKSDIILNRNYFEFQTESLGEIYKNDNCIFTFKGLELPWLNNQRKISCIAEGIYPYKKEIQKGRGKILRLFNIPDRDGVLMHYGNYAGSINPKTKKHDTEGCPLPGEYLTDIDGDGLRDVTNSKNTMNKIYDLLPDEGFIEIKS